MDFMHQELLQAIRTLRQRPGWTVHVVLTLALGIGAATAVFTVAQAVLFRPLGVANAARLVAISVDRPDRNQLRERLSPGRYLDVRDRTRAFDRVAAIWPLTGTLSVRGTGERVQMAWISASWFDLQGVVPLAGRPFAAADEAGDAPLVALISRTLCARSFDSAAGAIGQTLSIDGQAYTVVGVMPDVLPYPVAVDVWTPMAFRVWNRVSGSLCVVGRLAPGTSLERARAELVELDRQLARENPRSDGPLRSAAIPLAEQIAGRARTPLFLLLGAVGLLLVIACVNAASLLLALGIESERELAVRAALGASRGRLAAFVLARSLLVAALAGLLGAGAAAIATNLAMRRVAAFLPRAEEVTFDWRVLVFAVSMVILTALVAGVGPAVGLRGRNLQPLLGQSRGATASRARRRIRDALVVAEVALAFTLLAAAGLMINSLVRLSHVDAGFRTESIMTARLTLPMRMERYRREPLRVRFWEQVEQSVAALPGVTASGLVSSLPLGGTTIPFRFVTDDRSALPPERAVDEAEYRTVSAGYFRTVGIGRVAGRLFTDRDGRDGRAAAVINLSLARRLWPAGSPDESAKRALARSLSVSGPKGPFMPIVGVVADVRHFGLDRPPVPEIYVPFEQEGWPEMTIVARAPGAPGAVAAGIRDVVRALDREIGVYKVQPFGEVVGETTALRRLVTGLLAAFSSTALLLAAVGLSGLLAFSVAVRRREIGVRVALGAVPSDVVRLIAWHGVRLAGIGAAIGLCLSPWAGTLLGSQLFGVAPSDPSTLGLAAAVLLLVALGASALPALRASKVDPNVVLRAE